MNSPVVLFDGVCNLCSFMVYFILKHEKNHDILFAPLQSAAGSKIINQFNIQENSSKLNTVIFISNGKVYYESAAVIQIFSHLKKPFSSITALKYLPENFNNFFYRIISNLRYSLFGKRKECMMPDSKIKSRFIA